MVQVESSAPQAQQQWHELLGWGRSRSVKGAAKRLYVMTKITRANSKKVVDTQDDEEL